MQQSYNDIVDVVNELKNLKKTANDMFKEVNKMEEKVGYSKDEDVKVSFASYELQQERAEYERESLHDRFEQEKTDMRDRFEREKDKMRKSYRTIIAWICGILIALVVGGCATVIWFFSTYDFMSVSQDGDGINNYAHDTEQGDVIYEPKDQADSTS